MARRPIVQDINLAAHGESLQRTFQQMARSWEQIRKNVEQTTRSARQATRNTVGSNPLTGNLGGQTRGLSVFGGPGGYSSYLPDPRLFAFGAMVAGLKQSIQFTSQYQDQLATLRAISGATAGQLGSMRESIEGIGSATRYSLSDLTEISTKLAQTGVSAGEMKDALQAVTNLATASGATPQEAVDLVTASLGSFQLQATEATRVSDLMVTALNRTRLTTQQAALAIQYVGSTAAEQNIQLDELLAVSAALSQAGIRSGSTIGTGFRRFLVDLQTPTKKLQQEFDRLGLSQKEVDVATRGLLPVLKELKNSGFDTAAAYDTLQLRSAAFYSVAYRNVDLIEELNVAMLQQESAADASAIRMDTLTAQWQRFKNVISDGIAEAFEPLANWLKNRLREVTDLSQMIEEINAAARKFGADQRAEFERTGSPLAYFYASFYETLAGREDVIGGMAEEIASLNEEFDKSTSTLGGLEESYHRLVDRQAELPDGSRAVEIETKRLVLRFPELANKIDLATGSVAQLKQGLRELAEEEANTSVHLAQQTYRKQLSLVDPSFDRARREAVKVGVFVDPIGGGKGRLTQAWTKALSDKSFTSDDADAVLAVLRQEPYASNPAYAGFENSLIELANIATPIRISKGFLQNSANQGGNVVSELENYTGRSPRGGEAGPREVTFRRPVSGGRISSGVGPRRSFRTSNGAQASSNHRGVDIEAARGSKVVAAASGVVSFAGVSGGYGNLVKLDHGAGVETRYAHLDRLLVSAGDFVEEGQQIGTVGATGNATGPHLHYERRVNGVPDTNPLSGSVKVDPSEASGNRGKYIDESEAAAEKALEDARRKLEREVVAREKFALKTNERELSRSFERLKESTDEITFEALQKDAEASLQVWADQLKAVALAELDRADAGDIETQARLAEVAEAVEAKRKELDDTIFTSIGKRLTEAIDAAQRAFDTALRPGQTREASLQGRISGLGLFSNRNAPDFVTQLAQSRLAQEQERNLPIELAATERQIESIQKAMTSAQAEYEKYRDDNLRAAQAAIVLREQEELLQDALARRAELSAQLSASDLLPKTYKEGLSQAAQAYQEAHNTGATFKEFVMGNLTDGLGQLHGQFTTFFTDIITGSQSILGAFGNMARGIIKYLEQLAAKFVANKLFDLILSSIGGNKTPFEKAFSGNFLGNYNGGYIRAYGGRYVTEGVPDRDSSLHLLSKGEYVVRRPAVESLGVGFMKQLNERGAGALQGLGGTALVQRGEQRTNVYVVAPGQQPTMGPNDVLITIADDILRGGQTKRLIQSVVNN